MFDIEPTPIVKLEHELFTQKEIGVWMKLDYLNHEFVSGNKLRKLKYNLENFHLKKYESILSFGGPYSNHLAALSYLGKINNIPTIGFVRGNYHLEKSDTIEFCESNGMIIKYLSVEEYRIKETTKFLEKILLEYPSAFILPEGGKNDLAKKGCGEIVTETESQLSFEPDFYFSAVGTGTTIAGIAEKITDGQQAIGIAVIKGENVSDNIQKDQNCYLENFKILENYHFGGYAKSNESLIAFSKSFVQKYAIPIDPIYNAKCLYAIFDLAEKNYFPTKSKILVIHTGGLQGIDGFCKKNNLSTSIFR